MTYRATLYYTGDLAKSVTVEANNRNEAHEQLLKILGWECHTLERLK